MRFVNESIANPREFLRKHEKQFRNWLSYYDVDPVQVALYKLTKGTYISHVDWRSTAAEIYREVRKLLKKKEIDSQGLITKEHREDADCKDVLLSISGSLESNQIAICLFEMPSDSFVFGLIAKEQAHRVSTISSPDFSVCIL